MYLRSRVRIKRKETHIYIFISFLYIITQTSFNIFSSKEAFHILVSKTYAILITNTFTTKKRNKPWTLANYYYLKISLGKPMNNLWLVNQRMFYLTESSTILCAIALSLPLMADSCFRFKTLISTIYDSKQTLTYIFMTW